jgi:thiol-disulfide isomerase/thioredoxin
MSNSTKALIGVLLAGCVGIFIFLFVHIKEGRGPDGSTHMSLGVGTQTAKAGCVKGQRDCLPDVNYIDTTGKAYSSGSLNGKIVLVNFWATWCKPCQHEIPALSKSYDKYKDKNVVFLGVMTDSADDQALLNFESDHEMTYPVVRANSDILVSYNYPESLPTTFVFDRSGKQIFSKVGGVTESELDALLKPAL